MLVLPPSASLRIITSDAGSVHAVVGWSDTVNGNLGAQGNDTATITTATTTTLTTCPAASYVKQGANTTIRRVASISIANTHASIDQTITLQVIINAVAYRLAQFSLTAGTTQAYQLNSLQIATLEPGDALQIGTDDAITTDIYAAWEDRYYGSQIPNQNGAAAATISTAATTTVFTVQARINQSEGSYVILRTLSAVIVANTHATDPQTFTLRILKAGVGYNLLTHTLAAGDSYRYETRGDVLV